MKIIYMGTPDFAVAPLKLLLENNYNIVAVVTAPDKPSGRGLQIQQSAVKEFAVQHHLKILQPVNLKDSSFIEELRSLNADLQIVVAFRMLPEVVWNMPPLGTFNLHASLLPQYRGAAPINWAIIRGEKVSGVTTFFLQHKIDTGNIIMQEEVAIGENETAGELHDKLMNTGAILVFNTVKAIETGNVQTKEQHSNIPLEEAPKIFKENCRINWNETTLNIHNFIRGLSPYPTAYTELISPKGEKYSIKIFKALKEGKRVDEPGAIISDNKKELFISTTDGCIKILELQLAGKKRISTEVFLNGFKFEGNWTAK